MQLVRKKSIVSELKDILKNHIENLRKNGFIEDFR